ncbi:MAG: TIGR00725 family protein [Candidatus Vogelbacteria bacterium]|nr:TIGR00725 family protein [Candidatus Vogelbacteria bacterium]
MNTAIKRKFQIGVMGSAADLKYSKKLEKLAEEVGQFIAQSGNITVYGAEKDYDSLSTAASRGAKKAGGLTVGVTYGKGKDIWDKDGYTDVIICSGLERGGGREFVLVNSCDAVIIISGGSGTLTEAAIAYQLNIPVIALTKTGGWADKLAGEYFDQRKRFKVLPADTAQEAVNKALDLIK